MVCGYKHLDFYYGMVAEGFNIHVWELTGQKVVKEVKLGLMSVHGAQAFLLKKTEETVHEGVDVIQP